MDLGLTGKNVIVTGSTSNLGYAIAKAFIKEGANVAIVARTFEHCQEVADTFNTLGGGRAIPVQADVTRYDEVESMVKKTLDAFTNIDVLVNNVGWNVHGLFTDLDRKLWPQIIDKNYTHILNTFHAVLPLMIKQKSGNIISISSIIGRRGDETEAVYSGLKAGHIAFSKSVALQVARLSIRINVVAPGLIPPTEDEEVGPRPNTAWGGHFPKRKQAALVKEAREEIPMGEKGDPATGRIGRPHDCAMAVLFLASDVMSAHITGSVIGVDGGLYMGW